MRDKRGKYQLNGRTKKEDDYVKGSGRTCFKCMKEKA